jgi:formylglycine-generating enzyme required for sulfatase activity
MDRPVAIKVLGYSPALASDPIFRARFVQEARVISRIEHPNIVAIYDFGMLHADGPPYIVMELLQGHDLDQELSLHGEMELPRALEIIRQTLSALSAVHEQGIVHRDLKPSNLFLVAPRTEREAVKLVDFGIARLEGVKFTQEGHAVGTPQYLSPEYIQSQYVTPGLDVYQVGLILVELLTGLPVVNETSAYQSYKRHIDGDLRLPARALQGRLGQMVRKALHMDPAQRYPDASAFLHDLLEVQLQEGLTPRAREVLMRLSGGVAPIARPAAQPPKSSRAPSRPAEPARLEDDEVFGAEAARPLMRDSEVFGGGDAPPLAGTIQSLKPRMRDSMVFGETVDDHTPAPLADNTPGRGYPARRDTHERPKALVTVQAERPVAARAGVTEPEPRLRPPEEPRAATLREDKPALKPRSPERHATGPRPVLVANRALPSPEPRPEPVPKPTPAPLRWTRRAWALAVGLLALVALGVGVGASGILGKVGRARPTGPIPPGFVRVEPATFQMGSNPGELGRSLADEEPHRVTVSEPFLLSATEVTQGQWDALMRSTPSAFSDCGPACPVERVSWWDALMYTNALSASEGLEACYTLKGCEGAPGVDLRCREVEFVGLGCAGYRLPTEAEWELAARAGTSDERYASAVRGIAWFEATSERHSHPVAQKLPNALGLYDMLGNVWEWTWDAHAPYPKDEQRDPLGPKADAKAARVYRGGSWYAPSERCRSAARDYNPPDFRVYDLGFRVARSW